MIQMCLNLLRCLKWQKLLKWLRLQTLLIIEQLNKKSSFDVLILFYKNLLFRSLNMTIFYFMLIIASGELIY